MLTTKKVLGTFLFFFCFKIYNFHMYMLCLVMFLIYFNNLLLFKIIFLQLFEDFSTFKFKCIYFSWIWILFIYLGSSLNFDLGWFYNFWDMFNIFVTLKFATNLFMEICWGKLFNLRCCLPIHPPKRFQLQLFFFPSFVL